MPTELVAGRRGATVPRGTAEIPDRRRVQGGATCLPAQDRPSQPIRSHQLQGTLGSRGNRHVIIRFHKVLVLSEMLTEYIPRLICQDLKSYLGIILHYLNMVLYSNDFELTVYLC